MAKQNLFKRLAISDTGFVFDPQTGYSYTVNEMGSKILNYLKNNMDDNSILKELLENYEVSEEQAKRDYDSFLLKLKQYGLHEEK